jgi:hypothetical protein
MEYKKLKIEYSADTDDELIKYTGKSIEDYMKEKLLEIDISYKTDKNNCRIFYNADHMNTLEIHRSPL